MTKFINGNVGSFEAGEDVVAFRRVRYSSGTVIYSDAGEAWIGITEQAKDSGEQVSVRLRTAAGTLKIMAAGAFSAGAQLYGAADGKVDDVATGQIFGMALGAATADGDIIEAIIEVGVQHINYDVIYGELLSGGTEQNTHEASATQNYPLGTRRVTPEGDEYRYAKAGATLNCDLGVWSFNTQHIAYTTVAASALINAEEIVIDVGGSDGVGADGAIAADELVGGCVVVFPHSENSFTRRITANTVIAAGGGEVTLTLNKPIPVAITVDADHCEACASPYLDVRTGNHGGLRPVLGKADVAATVGQFVWLEVETDLTWFAPQGTVGVGAHDNQVVWRHDGSLDEHDYNDALNTKAQHAGTVMTRAAGETQGAPFIALRR